MLMIVLYLIELMLYVMAVVGGIGYACYNHAYLIALAIGYTAFMAWDKVKAILKKLDVA